MSLLNKIEEALDDLRLGKMIIVVDDEERENEGDFICAGEFSNADNINFMAKHGRGLICVGINKQLAQKLKLPFMVEQNTSKHETAFTVSIDAAEDITTGISAADRSKTIMKLVQNDIEPDAFVKPGHIFPLIAKPGGIFERTGHTEAAVDLMRLSGLKPVGTLCEIMNDDGTMARLPQLQRIAEKYKLKIISIKDLVEYRKVKEQLIHHESVVQFPTIYGLFNLHIFTNKLNPTENHLAIVKGELNNGQPVLCRVHSECLTGDVFGSRRCDCGEQLDFAMKAIAAKGSGVVLYMRQEGRGIGLLNKIKAYELQDLGFDTVEANHQLGFESDLREYYLSAQILDWFKINKIELMTNNPGKIDALKNAGIDVKKRIPIELPPHNTNKFYLKTKKEKMGHLLKIEK